MSSSSTRMPGRIALDFRAGPIALRGSTFFPARRSSGLWTKLPLLPRSDATDVAARSEHPGRGVEGRAKERPRNRPRQFLEESAVSPCDRSGPASHAARREAQRCRDSNHQGLDRLRRDLGRLGDPRRSGDPTFRDERRREEVYRPGPLLVGFPRAGPSSAPRGNGCTVEREPDRRLSEAGAGLERARGRAPGRPPHAHPPRVSRHDRVAAVAQRGGGVH